MIKKLTTIGFLMSLNAIASVRTYSQQDALQFLLGSPDYRAAMKANDCRGELTAVGIAQQTKQNFEIALQYIPRYTAGVSGDNYVCNVLAKVGVEAIGGDPLIAGAALKIQQIDIKSAF